VGGKVKGRRLLISLAPDEERAIRRAAKLELLPLATFIRRAAVFAARARIEQEAEK
jgi:uncharacterized protein (DUF1778 family)